MSIIKTKNVLSGILLLLHSDHLKGTMRKIPSKFSAHLIEYYYNIILYLHLKLIMKSSQVMATHNKQTKILNYIENNEYKLLSKSN